MQCMYTTLEAGRCEEKAIMCSCYCVEHNQMVCVSCGGKATHDCDITGRPVCNNDTCSDYDFAAYKHEDERRQL